MQVIEISSELAAKIRDADNDYQLKQSVLEEGGGPESDQWDMSWDLWDEADSISADLLHTIRLLIREG